MKTTRLIGTMCKWSDPFSKRVLIGRGLDPILIRYSICNAVRYSVLRVHPQQEKQMTRSFVWPVSMTVRFHLFPFRTQKLSSLVPKIVGWRRPVKIGRCRLLKKAASGPSLGPGPEIAYYAPLAQLVALVANTKAGSR